MRRVFTAEDVPAAGDWRIPIGAIVTPSAREVAGARGVRVVELPEDQCSALAAPEKTIAMSERNADAALRMTSSLRMKIRSDDKFKRRVWSVKIFHSPAKMTAVAGVLLLQTLRCKDLEKA